MRGEGLERLDESLGDLEGVLCDGVPEIVIHRSISVAQGDVADNAEGDKRHLIYIARVRDGTTLHIDGFCLGEVTDDLTHLLLGVDEPVTCDDKAWDDFRGVRSVE